MKIGKNRFNKLILSALCLLALGCQCGYAGGGYSKPLEQQPKEEGNLNTQQNEQIEQPAIPVEQQQSHGEISPFDLGLYRAQNAYIYGIPLHNENITLHVTPISVGDAEQIAKCLRENEGVQTLVLHNVNLELGAFEAIGNALERVTNVHITGNNVNAQIAQEIISVWAQHRNIVFDLSELNSADEEVNANIVKLEDINKAIDTLYTQVKDKLVSVVGENGNSFNGFINLVMSSSGVSGIFNNVQVTEVLRIRSLVNELMAFAGLSDRLLLLNLTAPENSSATSSVSSPTSENSQSSNSSATSSVSSPTSENSQSSADSTPVSPSTTVTSQPEGFRAKINGAFGKIASFGGIFSRGANKKAEEKQLAAVPVIAASSASEVNPSSSTTAEAEKLVTEAKDVNLSTNEVVSSPTTQEVTTSTPDSPVVTTPSSTTISSTADNTTTPGSSSTDSTLVQPRVNMITNLLRSIGTSTPIMWTANTVSTIANSVVSSARLVGGVPSLAWNRITGLFSRTAPTSTTSNSNGETSQVSSTTAPNRVSSGAPVMDQAIALFNRLVAAVSSTVASQSTAADSNDNGTPSVNNITREQEVNQLQSAASTELLIPAVSPGGDSETGVLPFVSGGATPDSTIK